MRVAFLVLAVIAFAAARVAFEAHEGGDVIDGHYIVVFHKDAKASAVASHYAALTLTAEEEITHAYDMPGFSGYAAVLSKSSLEVVLAADDVVAYVEANQMAHATQCEATAVEGGLWGLARTTNTQAEPALVHNGDPTLGRDVTMYVLDTGTQCSHEEFNTDRCIGGHDEFPSEGGADVDKNGHGTHVASTMAGTKYGLCKLCNVVGVKVLSGGGSGSFAGVIAGINWVADQAKKSGNKKAVGNMSLGGGFSAAINDATDACVDAGVTMVVASGNSNADACRTSPASAEKAITVNSIQKGRNARSSFSNYGPCTDIFAPGSDILGAWVTGQDPPDNSLTRVISGTSMASPHAAGVVGLMLAKESSTPEELKKDISEASLKDMVPTPPQGTPNEILFLACPPRTAPFPLVD